jgi:hypothetical protein
MVRSGRTNFGVRWTAQWRRPDRGREYVDRDEFEAILSKLTDVNDEPGDLAIMEIYPDRGPIMLNQLDGRYTGEP